MLGAIIAGTNYFCAETQEVFAANVEIRGRGNSSWEAPKKPYRVKLGSKADIFRMGANKHWTLLANYYDPSLSKNKLSYDFSGELGLVSMDSENVILIMNGEYQGVYQLCEHIRIDKTRINITDWEKIAEDTAETISEKADIDNGDLEDYLVENMSWITDKEFDFGGETYALADYEIELPDIDGGYLLELDKNLDEVSSFYSRHNQPLMFKSPEYVKTNDDMLQYVKDYVNAFEAAIDTFDGYTTYKGKDVHYSELYDMDALTQYFLVTELFFNTDGMKKSTYMYKDNNEPMKTGPIWDMDWCAGSPYEQASPAEQWQTLFYDDEMVSEQWYRSIIGDPYFAYKVKKLYDSNRTAIESLVSEGGRIDKNVNYLKEAGIKNDAKWKPQNSGFTQNTENLKAWMKKRISWLDEQTVSVDSLLESWGTFNSNQENNTVISIEDITGTQEGVVSAAYEAELKAFGTITRVFGDSRYDTSVKVAKTFCKDVEKAVAASGKNFPDGLCGGPLAAALNAPLILTKDGGTDAAAGYVAENGIASGYVLGGEGALTDATVVEIFGLSTIIGTK